MKVRVHYHSGAKLEFIVPCDIRLDDFIRDARTRGGKIDRVEFL